jgi:hypothetical protein
MKKNWLQRAITYAPNALINIFAVVAIALLTVVAFNLDFDFITSWQFLVTTVALVVIFTLVHWSFYDAQVKALLSNIENIAYMEKCENEIAVITNTKEWVENRQEFVNWRNQNEKIDAHIKNVQNRLTKLKRRATKKQLAIELANVTEEQRKYLTEEQATALQKEYDSARQKSKYHRKKMALEEELTDEWIFNNIDKIAIDYNEIDTLFIESGTELQRIKKDRVEKRGKYIKDNGLFRVAGMLLTVAISAIVAEPLVDGGGADQWATFALRMVLLVYNLIMGLNYGKDFYVEYNLHNINSRVSITKEFKVWALNKGIFKVK